MHPLAIAFAALVLLASLGRVAAAEEVWKVRSGQVVFHFNVALLRDLGIDVKVDGADAVSLGEEVMIEQPNWTFTLGKGSDLEFRAEYGIVEVSGARSGSLRTSGGLLLRDRASGRHTQLDHLELVAGATLGTGAEGEGGADPLLLRSATTHEVFCELIQSMYRFSPKERNLAIHYLNARISESWARAIGRPDLAGWFVGTAEVRAEAQMLSSTPPLNPPYQPHFYGGPPDTVDVSLGILSSISLAGREGTFPTGRNGLTMSTTSCNLGNVDVPWLQPMQEDHPVIAMALYRLLNGRLEQIGVSWLKHGFFALSNNQCTTCEHPSDGSFLGVGCSDTYGTSNNSNRSYLGPRSEVDAYKGTWNCTGSHFAGGVPDCTRRHDGSDPHGPTDHRLLVADADLNNSGATYYYEAYYVIHGDADLHNNWGSRRCTMSWTGSTWNFITPSSNNALLWGPALERWGELRTTVAAGPGDGDVVLAVQTTDLGGGVYHYEYALLNTTSNRQIRSFSIPVAGVANLTNLGFHDNDLNPATDWQVTVENGTITWSAPTYAEDPNANALVFGYMFNFRFDADAAPVAAEATLGPFKPGVSGDVTAATRGPSNALVAAGDVVPAAARLLGVRPNPFDRGTTISFATVTRGARLDIYDAAGRRVRGLVDDQRAAGVHSVAWDGTADGGARVAPGVYYARLRSGAQTAVKSVVVVE